MAFEYKLVWASGDENFTQKLNEAGAEGFRFVAALPGDDPGFYPTILMERQIFDGTYTIKMGTTGKAQIIDPDSGDIRRE